MALIIEIKSNDKTLVRLGALNVSESEFKIPYGKGKQHYEVYRDGEAQGVFIEHKFEDGYEPLARKLVSVFTELLTIPK